MELFAAAAALSSAGSNTVIVGDMRVQALSPSLLRIEPRGPKGFEDRTTFTVVNRDFGAGLPLTLANTTAEPGGTHLLTTPVYDVLVSGSTDPVPVPSCPKPLAYTDVTEPRNSAKYASGASVTDRGACCALCDGDPTCKAWVHIPDETSARGGTGGTGANCWPLASFGGLKASTKDSGGDREFGCAAAAGQCVSGVATRPQVLVTDHASGATLYNSSADANEHPNLLHFPPPAQTTGYLMTDFPRFFVPEWGPTPIPAAAKPALDPALVPTNGYDFTNNVNGDAYVFLPSTEGFGAARRAFVALAGGCPLLPDYAYGTWFTWWHSYTEAGAKAEVERWDADALPLDVWALDMNWRNTSADNLLPGEVGSQDHYYDHPATQLFPNFTEWFGYLKGRGLRTYFNDHPFPVAGRGEGGLQTSAEEVSFRWNGLSEWMERGLTYWWFDHNWGFSIPPPFVNQSVTDGVWDGLDNAAWGSHVYYETVRVFDETVRAPAGDTFNGGRPMTLTKFGIPDWRPGMSSVGHAESPAQHRFPVWWTGDGVPIQGSVQSMVDAGVHGFKPFVHSDCGGDYRGKVGGDLLRWTAHCVFGTILRFHGNDHRPWSYDNATEDGIRSYLQTRYKLLPSLIAYGAAATATGFPLAARADLFWPEHAEAASNDQYVHLNDTLVAPIWDSSQNETQRSVWVPPGTWTDAWDGSTVTGPTTMAVTQPYERQPMWHRAGGLTVLASDPKALRVDEQDWSELTLEAYPHSGADIAAGSTATPMVATTRRTVHERLTSAKTELALTTGVGGAALRLDVGAGPVARGWVLRVHLRPGQAAVAASIDGVALRAAALGAAHIAPLAAADAWSHFPFRGAGAAPPHKAGPVLELRVPAAAHARAVEITVSEARK
jgi:hypothetical protein